MPPYAPNSAGSLRRPTSVGASREPAPRTRSPARTCRTADVDWAVATPPRLVTGVAAHRASAKPLAYAIVRLAKRFLFNDATADVRVDGVLRGVQTERNRETLSDTQSRAPVPHQPLSSTPLLGLWSRRLFRFEARTTGSNRGSKLSATEPNSEQLKEGSTTPKRPLDTPGSLRLGAGRSQVQILSPRSTAKGPAKAGPFSSHLGARSVQNGPRGPIRGPIFLQRGPTCSRLHFGSL